MRGSRLFRALLVLWLCGLSQSVMSEPGVGGASGSTTVGSVVTRISISGSPTSIRHQLDRAFTQAGAGFGVPKAILIRIAERESGFREEVVNCRVLGLAKERGIVQLHPRYYSATVACDPVLAIFKAAEILRTNYRAIGTWWGAVASYNWGLGNYRSGKAMPAQVRHYSDYVMRGMYEHE